MKTGDEVQYFNFPIVFLEGIFMEDYDRKQFLTDILYYHIYNHAEKLDGLEEYEEAEEDRFLRSAKYWNVKIGDPTYALQRGQELYDSLTAKVFVGIKKEIFWQFHNEEKTEFEWQCLIMYLALKSILGKKSYCKTDNTLLCSRMAGIDTRSEYHGIVINRYQLDKIKTELQLSWGVVYYSRYTRGFYAGIDISLEQLIFEAESRKKSLKEKTLVNDKKEALKNVLMKLNISAS